jgi:hypothetical protein
MGELKGDLDVLLLKNSKHLLKGADEGSYSIILLIHFICRRSAAAASELLPQ